jgi:hypothetical protein
MTSKKFVLLIAALLAGSSLPALAQGGGGGGAGGAASNGANGNGASGSRVTATQPNDSIFQNPIDRGVAPATSAYNNAGQTVDSAPSVSAVGHAANGKPIGSSGSGPGSPEQPIDSGSR